MASNFNIRDSIQNLSYFFHSIHSNSIFDIANSLDLKLSFPTQQISTQYLDNANNVNLVINLFFLCSNFMEIDNYSINPEIQFLSDHAPLTVNIILIEEFISFKTNNILSLKIARNKKNLLLISSQLSISQLSYTKILLNSLFRSMQML